MSDSRYNLPAGEMPERLNGAVSKTVMVLVAIVGSNPTLSADLLTLTRETLLFLSRSYTLNPLVAYVHP